MKNISIHKQPSYMLNELNPYKDVAEKIILGGRSVLSPEEKALLKSEPEKILPMIPRDIAVRIAQRLGVPAPEEYIRIRRTAEIEKARIRREVLADLGRAGGLKGGRSHSDAKVAASRENGKKGGRPQKKRGGFSLGD